MNHKNGKMTIRILYKFWQLGCSIIMVTYVVNFGSRNIVVCQQEINKFEGIRYYTYKVVSFGRDKAILYPTHCL